WHGPIAGPTATMTWPGSPNSAAALLEDAGGHASPSRVHQRHSALRGGGHHRDDAVGREACERQSPPLRLQPVGGMERVGRTAEPVPSPGRADGQDRRAVDQAGTANDRIPKARVTLPRFLATAFGS